MNTYLEKNYKTKAELYKYFVVGVSGVLLDIGSLYALKECLDIKPTLAIVLNQALLLVYIFILNKFWTFRNKSIARPQVLRFACLACANYAFSILWMFLFTETFSFDYIIVRLANIALATAWNFLLYKYWVFIKHEHSVCS